MKNGKLMDIMMQCLPIIRRSDLIDNGIYPATIANALALDDADDRKLYSPFPGVICSKSATSDPMFGQAAVCSYVPSGVISMESATLHHGLSDACPFSTQMIVPQETFRSHRSVHLYRTRVKDALLIGVDSFEALGVTIRVTNPARTVVDLIRTDFAQDTALVALAEYCHQGYSQSELADMASAFGVFEKILPMLQATDAYQARF